MFEVKLSDLKILTMKKHGGVSMMVRVCFAASVTGALKKAAGGII